MILFLKLVKTAEFQLQQRKIEEPIQALGIQILLYFFYGSSFFSFYKYKLQV